jgi:hypothetical protein
MAVNFPNVGKVMNMQVQEALEPKIGLTIKELHIILCLK